MRKTYRYKNIEFPVEDEKEVIFTIEFISDGNSGHTAINVPGPDDPEIEDEGSTPIGKGKFLRKDTTVIVSDIANLIPGEDEIRIRYKLNDKIIVEHFNPKSEADRPLIIIFVKFPVV